MRSPNWMSHRSALVTLMSLLIVIAAFSAPGFAATRAKVKLATLAPKGSSFHQALQEMGEAWRNAPGGGVSLTIYTDGTMGGEADMVRRMRVGQIQAAMLTATGLSEIDDSVAALQNMPMIFQSFDELQYVREKLRPEIERKFRTKGFVVLFWGDAGWVRLFSRRPGEKPEDFTTMKMFVSAGDVRTMDLWKIAGYQPVPLEVADILPGLQTGLIDAVYTSPSYALAGQFYGPASNMLDLHWAPLVGATVMTEKSWNSLPAEAREAIMTSASKAGEGITARSRSENEESIDAMKKRGLSVRALSPEAEAAWKAKCIEFYPKIRGSIVPADMFDQVQKLLEEYRKSIGNSHS